MSLKPESLPRHELIGLYVQVDWSTDPGLVGLFGRVIDETRNTLLLETERSAKRIAKACTSLIFTLPDGQGVRVQGSVLVSQPENRISKRMQRTRWKL